MGKVCTKAIEYADVREETTGLSDLSMAMSRTFVLDIGHRKEKIVSPALRQISGSSPRIISCLPDPLEYLLAYCATHIGSSLRG